MELSEETLDWLQFLSERCAPPPWTASVEGRDHDADDSFIAVGEGPSTPRIRVSVDGSPAGAEYLDLIAAARTYLPLLIEEILEHRAEGVDRRHAPDPDPASDSWY